MQTKYVVRQLVNNEYFGAAGLRYAVFELLADSAQTVALFYEEAQARRVCNALQQYCERGTKPLGATPMFISSVSEIKPAN
jgi:hypothetical protein